MPSGWGKQERVLLGARSEARQEVMVAQAEETVMAESGRYHSALESTVQ
jgi:hypothetical protein